MPRIIIQYLPELSEESRAIIEREVSPCMTSPSGFTNQYDITLCLESITNEIDVQYITQLIINDVSYLEF